MSLELLKSHSINLDARFVLSCVLCLIKQRVVHGSVLAGLRKVEHDVRVLEHWAQRLGQIDELQDEPSVCVSCNA